MNAPLDRIGFNDFISNQNGEQLASNDLKKIPRSHISYFSKTVFDSVSDDAKRPQFL